MDGPSIGDQKSQSIVRKAGTLAIDLGNTTTVVLFQGERDVAPILLDLKPISRSPGEIPSLVFKSKEATDFYLVGQQVIDFEAIENNQNCLCRDFKKWIGKSRPLDFTSSLLPEEAGEVLIQQLWARLPKELEIKRLVLTAPVESYRSYRRWLLHVCSKLPIQEIALVDEPTAAALGAGLPSGSKLLVVDLGGSTIDMSLVALEGGEGKAEPIAQLLRFNGRDLEGKSNQILRCAKVLGKAGQQLGGRDIDRWIAHHLLPEEPITELLLNAAEKLKCRLSSPELKGKEMLIEPISYESLSTSKTLQLCRDDFEKLINDKGLINCLSGLLKQTLASASANNCKLEDLQAIVVVGGGARIPYIRRWLISKSKSIPLLTPPPIEAVAKGALSLTPGVKIKDILHRGVSLKYWEKKGGKHLWHPLFLAGQPWPTEKPFELVLAASQNNQIEVDLILGEPQNSQTNEIIYVNGIPKIADISSTPEVIPWEEKAYVLTLDQPAHVGEDCLRLSFNIDSQCQLKICAIDTRTGAILKEDKLGSVR